MSRILLTKTDNGWLTPDGTPFAANIKRDWYMLGTKAWINPMTKYIDTHPNGNDPSLISDVDKEWYTDGKLHRVDGPAQEWSNGDKAWFIEGQLHREDGPAIERRDRYKGWLIEGRLHRLDGPAQEWSNGSKAWWVDGVKYTKKKYESQAVLDIRCRFANTMVKLAD